MKRRILSLFLCLSLLVSIVQVGALAASVTGTDSVTFAITDFTLDEEIIEGTTVGKLVIRGTCYTGAEQSISIGVFTSDQYAPATQIAAVKTDKISDGVWEASLRASKNAINDSLKFTANQEYFIKADVSGSGTDSNVPNAVNYYAASFVKTGKNTVEDDSWFVVKQDQSTLTVNLSASSGKVGGATATATASGGSGTGAVTYASSDTSVATINESTGVITPLKVGTTTITATKAGDDTYNAATSSGTTYTVGKGTVSIATPDSNPAAYKGVAVDVADSVSVKCGDKALQKTDFTVSEVTLTNSSNGAVTDTTKVTFNNSANATEAVTFKVTLQDAAADNYEFSGSSDNATGSVTYNVSAGTPNTATFTAPTGAVQYGDEFTISVTLGNNTGTVTWPETSAGNYEKISSTATSATYKMLAHSGKVTLTATQAPTSAATPVAGFSHDYEVSAAQRMVKIGGLTAENKTYDGQKTASFDGTAVVANKVGSDNVTLTGTSAGEFASADAGNNISVTYKSGLSLASGGDNDKYTMTGAELSAEAKANITKAKLALTTTAAKTYDGKNTMKAEELASKSMTGVNGETFNLTEITATYSDKEVHTTPGTSAVTGFKATAAGGAKAANYDLTDVTGIAVTDTVTKLTITLGVKNPGTVVAGTDLKPSDLLEITSPASIPDALDTIFADGLKDKAAKSAQGLTVTVYDTDGTAVDSAPYNFTAAGTEYKFDLALDKTTFDSAVKNYALSAAISATTNNPLTVTSRPTPPPVGQDYTVTYAVGEGGKLADGAAATEKVKRGEMPVSVPQVVADEGYKFLGWSLDGGKTFVNPAERAVNGNITYTAVFAKCDHLPYMNGTAPDKFAPQANLNRAQAVTMLSRLTEGFDEEAVYDSQFTDLEAGAWYVNYVGFGSQKGIVEGYSDGTYRPLKDVTRGEFVAMVARFMGVEPDESDCPFEDCDEYWGKGYITALAKAGIVDGYNGTEFRPNQTITRAEAAKIVNGAIGRTPDKDKTLEGYANPFADVAPGVWYYHDVLEATVPHLAADFH